MSGWGKNFIVILDAARNLYKSGTRAHLICKINLKTSANVLYEIIYAEFLYVPLSGRENDYVIAYPRWDGGISKIQSVKLLDAGKPKASILTISSSVIDINLLDNQGIGKASWDETQKAIYDFSIYSIQLI